MAPLASSRSLFVACAALLLPVAAATPCAGVGAEGGFLSIVVDMAPACFEACQGTCGPMASAIDTYFAQGDVNAVEAVVCQAQEDFKCLVAPENLEKCGNVLAQANALDFRVPRTEAAFAAACGAAVTVHNDISASNTTETTEAPDSNTTAGTTAEPASTTEVSDTSGAYETSVAALAAGLMLLAASAQLVA